MFKGVNSEKTEHIYLYRVKIMNNKKTWIWYGKYRIISIGKKLHNGKNGELRYIYILGLEKI
jgi:hypothetical protein